MKKSLIIFSLACALYANSAYEIAKNIVNDGTKDKKLRALFPAHSYEKGGIIDLEALTQVLKENALYEYISDEAKDYSLSFHTRANGAIVIKSIINALEQIGVNLYLIEEFEQNGSEKSISFKINSKFSIDPGSLYKAFREMNVNILDARRDGEKYFYELDFAKAKPKVQYALYVGDELELTKPLEPYFLKNINAKKLSFDIGENYRWYPQILFFDNELNLIKEFSSEVNTKTLELEIPKNAIYLQIGDKFTLENIKLGLNIKVK